LIFVIYSCVEVGILSFARINILASLLTSFTTSWPRSAQH